MSRGRFKKNLTGVNLPTDTAWFETNLGHAMSIGPTEPTRLIAPSGLWLDTTNKVLKTNTGTLGTPVFSSVTGSSSALAQSVSIEAGTYDLTWATTTQLTGTATITIPNLGGVSQQFVFSAATQTLTNKTLTAPTIAGGTAIELTTFSLRDSNAAHDLIIASDDDTPISQDRTLSIDVNNSDRTIDLSGNLVLGGTFTTGGAWTQTGAHAVNLTTSGTTTLVLPTAGANFEVIAALNTSFTRGDILFYNSSGDWAILAVGANNETLVSDGTDFGWSTITSANASNLLDGTTLQDTGALDAILSFTEQTSSAPTLTVPDFAGASQTFAFLNLAQTWLQAQTFKYGKFEINDNNDSHQLTVNWEENEGSADRALDIKVNGGDRIIDLSGNLVLGGTLTTLGAWTHVGAHTLQITTGGATTVTLPTTGTLSALGGTETFSGAKTFDYGMFLLNDNNDSHALTINWEENEASSARALDLKVNGGDRIIDLSGNIVLAGTLTTLGAWTQVGAHSLQITTGGATTITVPTTGTLATLAGTEILSNKVLTLPQINDTSSDHQYVFAVSELAADRVVTLPLLGAADEFVFKTHAVTLANKTIDVDANTVTNINADELDPTTLGATSAYAVPFVITKVLTNLPDTGTNIYVDNCPFKLQILDAVALSTTANGGTWAVHKGKVDALGNAFIEAVTVAATDKLVTRPLSCDDDYQEIASGGSIVAVGDAGDALDIKLVLTCIRSD